MSPQPLRRRLAFAAVTVCLVLAAVELAARLAGPPPEPETLGSPFAAGGSVADPDYGWRLQPGSRVSDPVRRAFEAEHGRRDSPVDDRVNRHAFRDTPLAEPRPEAQRRVLVLGDSSVHGSGVPVHLRFTELLERALEPRGSTDPTARTVEVINGGTPGWTSAQSLVQLEDSLHLGLDAVVVYNMNSDMMQAEGGVPDHLYFAARRRLRAARGLEALAATRWLRHLLAPLAPQVSGEPGQRRVPVSAYRDLLIELGEVARRHELGLVFVLPTQSSDLERPLSDYMVRSDQDAIRLSADLSTGEAGRPEDKRAYRIAMGLAAHQLGAPVVDAPAAFHEAWRRQPGAYQGADALFVDAIHPGVSGHALLAEQLLPVLAAQLAATPPWAERRARVPAAAPPAWLAEAPPDPGDGPPVPHDGPPPPEDDSALQVPCRAGASAPDQVQLDLALGGVSPEQEVRIGLLQPGINAAPLVLWAPCRGPRASVSVPRRLGRVRVVAVVDLDGDGPCYADPAAAGEADLDLAAAPAAQSLSLGEPSLLGPFAPPYGLPYGVYPLLAALGDSFGSPRFQGRYRAGVGMLFEPGVEAWLDLDGALRGTDLASTESGASVQVSDVLDRPDTPLSRYDGVVVVAALGSDLSARVAAALVGEVASGWTDPAGLSWSLVLPRRFDPVPFAERVDADPFLPFGEGRARAARGEGPILPQPLSAAP